MSEKIRYWMYQFEMPEEDKRLLESVLSQLNMTMDTFLKCAFEYAAKHPEKAENIEPMLNIRQVGCYPVYENETEDAERFSENQEVTGK